MQSISLKAFQAAECIGLRCATDSAAGEVDTGLYKQDCLFADPTIRFRGREKYVNNLQTLKAFFVQPRIELYSLKKADCRLKASSASHAHEI